jgi:hypothetical protein
VPSLISDLAADRFLGCLATVAAAVTAAASATVAVAAAARVFRPVDVRNGASLKARGQPLHLTLSGSPDL